MPTEPENLAGVAARGWPWVAAVANEAARATQGANSSYRGGSARPRAAFTRRCADRIRSAVPVGLAGRVRPARHRPSPRTVVPAPAWSGSLFPLIFITIACGAVSGFHALIWSGTTPKLLDNERNAGVMTVGV